MSLWQRSRALRITTWVALAVLVVTVLPWGYLYWQTERDLQAELARIRAAGEPTSLSDLVPPQIPDEENAAVVYVGMTDTGMPLGDARNTRVLRDYVGERAPRPGQTGPPIAQQARAILNRPETVEALERLKRASQMRYATRVENVTGSDGVRAPAMRAMYEIEPWLQAVALRAAEELRSIGCVWR